MAFRDYRNESRVSWGTNDAELTLDQIQIGAILRIADATELMAKNHAQLIAERDRFERWYKDEKRGRELAERRINALRGVITKMKKQARS